MDDPDAIVAAARAGLPVAPFLLPDGVIPAHDHDWPDMLAARLRRGPLSITAWAIETGLDPATVSRGFCAAFGITPARYRLEHQTLRAMRLLASTAEPLAAVATACGFADQAHLSRTIRSISGHTPRTWRVKSIQDREGADDYQAAHV